MRHRGHLPPDPAIFGLQWHPELLVDKPLEGTVDPMAVFRYFASLI